MYTKRQLLYHLFAEIEAYRSNPGYQLTWRRKELHSLDVQFGNVIWVGKNFYLLRSGNLTLGERCALGENCQIFNHAKITIGDDFLVASDLLINSGTHDPISLIPSGHSINIGDRVWCGVRVTILADVNIGNDVVIGAGSVVNKDIPSNCIVAGIPAKPIKELKRDDLPVLWSWI